MGPGRRPSGRPDMDAMDLRGLDIDRERFEQLVAVDPGAWVDEAERNGKFLDRFGERLPYAIKHEHETLIERLRKAVS